MTDPRKARDAQRRRLKLNPRPPSQWCNGFTIPARQSDIDRVEAERLANLGSKDTRNNWRLKEHKGR